MSSSAYASAHHSPLKGFDEQAPIILRGALKSEVGFTIAQSMRLHAERTRKKRLLASLDREAFIEAVVIGICVIREGNSVPPESAESNLAANSW